MEHPILFSTEMVKAILGGRKTQTRRVVKFDNARPFTNSDSWPYVKKLDDNTWMWADSLDFTIYPSDYMKNGKRCPYGQVGDKLWARETHYSYGRWILDGFNKTGSPRYKFDIEPNGAVYFEDNKPSPENIIKKSDTRYGWAKRPSIFLFHGNSRLTLEITEVRVQRLQEISEADCGAEGIDESSPLFNAYEPEYDIDRKDAYKRLWDSINGKNHPWESNPFVWAITFKVL